MNKQAKIDAFMKEDLNGNIEERREEIQGPYDLPEGWKWTKLRNIAEIIMGQSPPSITYNKEGKGLPFYQGKADFGVLYPTPHVWCSEPNKIAEAGDVLISVRAPVGPVNLCKERSCIGRGLAAIRPRNHVFNNFFLFYYLRSIENKWIGKGSTFEAIKKRDLEDLLIPLPPLEEQKRIVSRLEQLVSRAEEAKRLRKLAREEAERIMQAALNKVFSKAEEEGWEQVKIEKIVSLQKGNKPSKLFNEKIEGSVPYLTAQYMRGLEEPKYCLKTDDIILTEEKDVLIIMDGSYSGDTFIGFNGALASTMAKFLFNKSIILPEYLYYFLRNNFEILNTKTKGAAIPHVRNDVLFNLQVPLPPLEEQKRIIVYLDKLRETIESIRELQQKTEEELEKLVPSILDKAFRGEL